MSNVNWVSVIQYLLVLFVVLSTMFGVVSVVHSFRGELQKAKLYLWFSTVLSLAGIALTLIYIVIR